LLVLHPDHGAQDHLHRDRAHPRPQSELLPDRPMLDLRGGDLLDQPCVVGYRLAVKWGQQQPPRAEMRLAVEHQQAVGAEHPERLRVGLTSPQHLAVPAEHLTDELRVEHTHHIADPDDPKRQHPLRRVAHEAEADEGVHTEHRPQGLRHRRERDTPRQPIGRDRLDTSIRNGLIAHNATVHSSWA
jgi:hypothetical protein